MGKYGGRFGYRSRPWNPALNGGNRMIKGSLARMRRIGRNSRRKSESLLAVRLHPLSNHPPPSASNPSSKPKSLLLNPPPIHRPLSANTNSRGYVEDRVSRVTIIRSRVFRNFRHECISTEISWIIPVAF